MKFSELAQTYDLIQQAKREPERVRILADLFRRAESKELEAIAHFTASEMVKPVLSDQLGTGPGTIRAGLALISGRDETEIDEEVRHTGDMSEVVALHAVGRDTLSVSDLWQRTNAAARRNEDRLKLVQYVFTHTTPAGAKYFTRMALNQMRINVGIGTIAKAIAAAFDVEPAQVEHLYAMSNDIGLAASRARRGAKALARTGLSIFRPYQFMNAHKAESAEDIFETLAGKQIIFEIKYDGARLQIHLKRAKPLEVRLYSRRLNDDTAAMPDVVEALRKSWTGNDAIIEGEAVAYDPTLKTKQAFQAVLMRLGRKHGIEEKMREIPLVLYLFDLLYHNGEDLMSVPQSERRERLRKLFRPTERVRMTDSVSTDRITDALRFFKQAIRDGHEGLMAKDPEAVYVPGRRANNWMKLKPAFETLDVVVVGGIWGSGRRRGTLSSLVVAVLDKDRFKTVGKVGTGFSEDVLKELTAKLEPKIIVSRGRNVEIEPEMVIEVDFQDIQKTTAYDAGYVLRIPRFKRERTDKSTREADTLARLKRLYNQTH
ncbi:MAG TPA: ATP-dependent DNA ligase [Pyrinomonadaceae bacterium]|jgi:DNA ligase-1|nr:ATP-dependent DNA ligase [Pyrinomonadaceae bacterium]